jgi:hypothetical protein
MQVTKVHERKKFKIWLSTYFPHGFNGDDYDNLNDRDIILSLFRDVTMYRYKEIAKYP